MVKFSKYHGTGNDFILLDNRNKLIDLTTDDIQKLCHRQYGIGADGFMLLNQSDQYDFEMIYYNSDGSSDTMCGNGGRCITAFAHRLGLMKKTGTFSAYDGVHVAEIISEQGNDTIVKISMSDNEMPEKIRDNVYFMNTGAPHLIVFCDNVESVDVVTLGAQFSNDICGRTNVNFVETHPDFLSIRTFERGVENETLSCGTGITASVLTYASIYHDDIKQNTINVLSRGGSLKVHYLKIGGLFRQIFLEGSTTFVFSGEIDY